MTEHTASALSAFLVSVSLVACAPSPNGSSIPGNETIRQEDLRADLEFLAGDGMRGRGPESPENALAAEFIEARFQRLGLEPAAPDGSYYQPFELITTTLGTSNRLSTTIDGRASVARMGVDVTPMNFSASASGSGELLLAGFGIASESLEYDDYAEADATGKVVLVFDHEPGELEAESPFDGLVRSEVSRDLRKALTAQERGAVGILFVGDVHNHEPVASLQSAHDGLWVPPTRTRYLLASWTDRVTIPAARISAALAERLVAGGGRSLGELSREAESGAGAVTVEIPDARINMTMTIERRRVQDRNVVALMRGADPELADEVVIVCAHYDHDGADGDRIYNGADDDGSGTVGVLEIAEAYALAAAAGQRPRRSVLFAAWNSEEVGLLGAWAYTENPLFPLDRTAAALNMDMIGRNEEVPDDDSGRFRGLEPQTAEDNANSVHIMAYTYSGGLRSGVIEANASIGLDLELAYDNNPSNLLRRSDQWPFLQSGVPALFFHTGLHPDYHRETDTPDRINYPKMERIVRLVHSLSWELANDDDRPTLDERRGTL